MKIEKLEKPLRTRAVNVKPEEESSVSDPNRALPTTQKERDTLFRMQTDLD